MSKVSVDRELLLQLFRCWDCGLEVDNELAQLRIAAAQPAETEGVELVPFWVLFDATTPEPLIKKHMPEGVLAFFDSEEDARRAKALHPGTDYKRAPYVRAAALSAVTAERDRLRSKWARVESERDRLLSDNASLRGSCKALGEENKQLKRENKRQGRTIAAMAAKEA